jgi:hypothetical protein
MELFGWRPQLASPHPFLPHNSELSVADESPATSCGGCYRGVAADSQTAPISKTTLYVILIKQNKVSEQIRTIVATRSYYRQKLVFMSSPTKQL